MPFEVHLFATLSKTGAVMENIRYLHATRDNKNEADELCKDLNSAIVNIGYRVVEVS